MLRELRVKGPKQVAARVAIAPGCRLGEHGLRLRCRSGLSELRTLWVGALPQRAEVEPNDDRARAQTLELGVTVEGAFGREDEEWFALSGPPGQRVVAEVEAARLGGPLTDPVLELQDAAGRLLAGCDDAPLLGQDAWVSALLPPDGRCWVRLRESSGLPRGRWRLHLGSFPRPSGAWPPGGAEPGALELLGEAAPLHSERALALFPPGPDGLAWLVVERAGVPAPWPLPWRRTDLPPRPELEPDDERARATEVALPGALQGRIERPGDVDWFRFQARKGERLALRAWARALGSPLDVELELFAAGGKRLAGNDDAQGRPDSALLAPIPADGAWELCVRDFLGRGGPDFVYQVEVAPAAPAPTLDLASYGRNSQARNSLVVPRGGRMAVLVRLDREGAAGPLELALEGLPAEAARVHTAVCAAEQAATPLLLEAGPAAPLGAWQVALQGRVGGLAAPLRHRVPLTAGPPNDSLYWSRTVDRLAVAVVEPAPFRIELEPPRAPLVPGGAGELAVRIARDPGCKAPLLLSLLDDPPGTSSKKDVRVEPGQERAVIPLTTSERAAQGRWPVVVVARGDAGAGEVLVASQLERVEVAAPFLRLELARVAGAQGGTVELAAEVELLRPLPGPARARLVGLPARCTAPVTSLDPAARTLRFPVAIEAQAPPGRHRGVTCEVVIEHEGGPIVHRLGKGELRVDPPAAPGAAPPPPATAPDGRPFGRLEQLRAERAAREAEARPQGERP